VRGLFIVGQLLTEGAQVRALKASSWMNVSWGGDNRGLQWTGRTLLIHEC